MEEGSLWGMITFLILIVINALVSGAEAAIYNLNEGDVRKKAGKGEKSARIIEKIMDSRVNPLSVTQTIVGFVSVTIIVPKIILYAGMLEKFLIANIEGINLVFAKNLSIVLLVIIMLYLILVLGILFPRKLAAKYAEGYAYTAINIVNIIVLLFLPVTKLLVVSTNLLLKLIGIDPNLIEESVTEEEIMSMVNEGHEQGVIHASEAEMITNIFEFGDKEAGDIMTHRKKIVAIDAKLSLSDAAKLVLNESYSRFPIYEENIDNIVGLLHLKDLMKYHVSESSSEISLKDIARDAYFIPETQNLNILFREMQSSKIHMAIAIDEYGQVAGLVAMEDILEEIVGSILDEYDEEEQHIKIQEDFTYMMEGITSLQEIEDVLEISFEDNDYDTLNGFLISKLERIPIEGESFEVLYEGYLFTIVSVKDNMIHLVKVSKESEQENEEL